MTLLFCWILLLVWTCCSTGVLRLNFDSMEGVLLENNQVVVQMTLRRLSTPSSEVEKFQPLATVWKWFWNSEGQTWKEYGQVRTRSQIRTTSTGNIMIAFSLFAFVTFLCCK